MTGSDSMVEKRIDVAVQSRALEVQLFWQRSLFFWGFNAGAFVGLATLYPKSLKLSLALSTFGLVSAVAWTLANRGSRRWHHHWEAVAECETQAVGGKLFKPVVEDPDSGWHEAWLGPRRYSVGKLTIALSDFVCLLWLCLLVYQLLTLLAVKPSVSVTLVLIWVAFTFVYIGVVAVVTRSFPRNG